MTSEKKDLEAENPDKPVTGAEEEPADMKPAEPTSEQAVSGGEALPSVAEDLRKPAASKAKAATTKPAAKEEANSLVTAPPACRWSYSRFSCSIWLDFKP